VVEISPHSPSKKVFFSKFKIITASDLKQAGKVLAVYVISFLPAIKFHRCSLSSWKTASMKFSALTPPFTLSPTSSGLGDSFHFLFEVGG
jgi:hypothetical protein